MLFNQPLSMPVLILSSMLVGFMLVLLITRNFPPKKPASIGIKEGTLALCENKPNCVCSLDNRPNFMISPLNWAGSEALGISKVEELVHSFPRTRVISKSDNYLHAEFATLLFGYVDDVEFLVDVKAQKIHMRSASRLGYSDLGANRSRIEKLKSQFAQIAEK